MANMFFTSLLFCFSLFAALQSCSARTTNFTLYVHGNSEGKDANEAIVAQSDSSFIPRRWKLAIVDKLATINESPTSTEIARVAGLVTATGVNKSIDVITSTVYFTSGDDKGSTINIQGMRYEDEQESTIGINSGTGNFISALGFVKVTTISFDAALLKSVFKFDFTVQL